MTAIVANGCLFIKSKVVFHFLVQNWQEINKKIIQYLWWFLGFVHSMANKAWKVSRSSNVDKKGLGEYQTMNFRHFLLS